MQTPPSVRLALPVEARSIASLQRAAWEADHSPALAAAMAAQIDEAAAAEAWHHAIVAPPLARFRVLVALDGERPVGYAAMGPSDDPDAEPTDAHVAEFVVDPERRREGHGSRLMHAVADTLVADGFTRARFWVPTTFDGLRAFLVAHSFAADGAHQEVSTETGATLKLLRLHTALVDPAP